MKWMVVHSRSEMAELRKGQDNPIRRRTTIPSRSTPQKQIHLLLHPPLYSPPPPTLVPFPNTTLFSPHPRLALSSSKRSQTPASLFHHPLAVLLTITETPGTVQFLFHGPPNFPSSALCQTC